MGIFTGIKDVKIRGGGNRERAGHYLERIDKIVTSLRTGPEAQRLRCDQDALFFEKTIIRVIDNAQGMGHQVGEAVSDAYFFYPANRETKVAAVKKAIMAILRLTAEEVTEDFAERITSPLQPLAGYVCECNNQETELKNPPSGSKKTFMKVNYLGGYLPSESLKILTPEEITRFFPDNFLQKQAAALASNPVTTQAPPPAPAPTPAPIPAPVVPASPPQGMLMKLAPGVAAPGYQAPPAGYVFASADGGKTWIFVAAA